LKLLTLGHGTASEVDLAALMRANGIRSVIDVRSVPKSRAHPRPRADSPNVALRHPSFRGYADYMQTPEFLSELQRLMRDAEGAPTAIMCSETLWWRCHRRLIADAATLLYDAEVLHIMHSGPLRKHALTDGVRALPTGVLQYDVVDV
jgi:uncharacterized protein (DUF488 family)